MSLCLYEYAENGDVTGHWSLDGKDATTLTTATSIDCNATPTINTTTTGTTAGGDDVDDDVNDDVDELSSSDVSSYVDIKHGNNLTSSTDDNLADYRSVTTYNTSTYTQTDMQTDSVL